MDSTTRCPVDDDPERLSAAVLPDWLDPLIRVAGTVRATDLSPLPPPPEGGRPAAVLLLFWRDPAAGFSVLLIERSDGLRSHAGQPAFPGGALDPGDAGPAAAALREAVEEIGVDPEGVEIFAVLPSLWIPHSGFVVAPVLGWWRDPSPVGPADPVEVAAVHCVPIADLVDPDNRLMVRHPPTGRIMPGFRVAGMLVWGFTAGVLDRLLTLTGWERPWPQDRVEDLPDEVLRLLPPASEPDLGITVADGEVPA